MKIEIHPVSDDEFDVYLNDGHNGRYASLSRAKAAARRMVTSHESVQFRRPPDEKGVLRGEVVPKQRRARRE